MLWIGRDDGGWLGYHFTMLGMGSTLPQESNSTDGALPPAPPPAPRELTAHVVRRAWLEQRVRIWWMMGLVVFVIVLYYASSRVYMWNRERDLIARGVRVDAEVMGPIPGEDWPRNKVLPAHASVDIRYTHNGQTFRPHSGLAGRKEQIYTGRMVPIYIDPGNPTRWTARDKPPQLMDLLLGAMLLVPVLCILLAVAIIQRRNVLRIWRDGEAVCAEVMDVRQAAAAPGSRVLRCAVNSGDTVQAVKVVVPAHKAPQPGELLWLIAPQGKVTAAIPAVLFE